MKNVDRAEIHRVHMGLYGINNTHEAQMVREYIDTKLEHFAQKALQCETDELQRIQGKADFARDMLRDLDKKPFMPDKDE